MECRLHFVGGMNDEKHDEKRYVLVIKRRWLAYGPFTSRDDAEYAALDYYGTAVTGASAWDEFLIAELIPADPAALSREHTAHVAGLMDRDD